MTTRVFARVTIYDNDGNPQGTYEIEPTRVHEESISTKYIFGFEYNVLNYDKCKAESELRESEDKE